MNLNNYLLLILDPNPFQDFKNCSLKEKGYICDPDEILEEEDSEYLNIIKLIIYH